MFQALKHTLSLLKRLHDGDRMVVEQYIELSMVSLDRGFSKLAIAKIKLCLDMYALLMFEPMNSLSRKLYGVNKECTGCMLKCSTRATSALVTANNVLPVFN